VVLCQLASIGMLAISRPVATSVTFAVVSDAEAMILPGN
jgi:hypothetical protein